jgi:general secretion pathway protein F
MPAYTYEALDDAGKPRTGVVEAENAKAARSQLRTQGLVPLSVAALAASVQSAGASRWSRRVFGSTGLAVWTRQLAGLVGAGLPLERALTALADEADQPAQRDLVAHLRAEVNAGSPFARALASAPREFDDVYRAVVAAGEQSGALGAVLERLADDLEERQALRSQAAGRCAVPGHRLGHRVVIVIFLVTYVVPQVARCSPATKRALPWLTVAMLGLSAFVRTWGWAAAGGHGRRRVAGRWRCAVRPSASASTPPFSRLPLVGRVARGYNAARFAGTLAMLAGAGVPILKALQAAAETLGNRAMRADALDALVQVREGAPLAAALAAKKRFPGLLAMFARLGEQTGQLPLMLHRAANQLSARCSAAPWRWPPSWSRC